MKGLYIHIPFCKQKCKYCDFVSFQRMEDTADKYIDALKREAEQYKGEKIDTILDNLKNKSLDYSFLDEISTVLKDIKDNKDESR